jgi:hypothetical protein
VFTRDQLSRTLRSRWLFAAVALILTAGALVLASHDSPALAAASDGATEAVSVNNSGGFGNLESFDPAISATGRFVAFVTRSALDPLDAGNDSSGNIEYDIYVRDTVAHTTTYISRGQESSDGDGTVDVASDGDSLSPSISANGRYIAFVTFADNIVESSHPSAVICDRGPAHSDGTYGQGCVYTDLRLFEQDGDVDQALPRLSADAHRVALLDDGVARVLDLTIEPSGAIGSVDATIPEVPDRVDCDGTQLLATADTQVALSADGRYLVRVTEYETESNNCAITNAVWVNDLSRDVAAQRLDLDAQGHFIGAQSNEFGEIAVSGDGRRIAFVVEGENVGEPAGVIPFVLHTVDRDPDGDGQFGPAAGQNVVADIASRDVAGAPVGGDDPSFSTDGRYLAFATDAAHVHNGVDVTDQPTSCINRPIIGAYSRPLDGPAAAGSTEPGRSATGRDPAARRQPGAAGPRAVGRQPVLAAETGISNCDVVVRDLVVDARRAAAGQSRLPAELASPSLFATCVQPPPTAPCEGNDDSYSPVLDADGSAVAFTSDADDLVESDENEHSDVFLRRFQPTLSVGAVNFGQIELGAAATGTATVTYSGFGPLPVGPVAIGGTNAGDFDVFPGQTCTGTVLHEFDTCMVSVRFRPGQLGTRTGTLSVTPGDGRPAVLGELTGVGVPVPPPRTPGFSAAPNPLAFGTRPLFTNAPAQTVTVTNTGTAPLIVAAVAPVGTAPTGFPADYTIAADTCLAGPVAPGASCQVSVVFAPRAVGQQPALLQFTDNALPGPQLVGLTGGGAVPTLTAVPPLAPPGAVSQVTGTGFPPGKVVAVTLDGMPGQITVTPGPTGTFTVPLVIFPHTAPGRRQLHATVQGVPVPVTVSIDYLVVPGSLQPPDFAERR